MRRAGEGNWLSAAGVSCVKAKVSVVAEDVLRRLEKKRKEGRKNEGKERAGPRKEKQVLQNATKRWG